MVVIAINFLEGMNRHYNKMVEVIERDDRYGHDEILLLVRDCEDDFYIEREGYVPYMCECGVRWEIRYRGTKKDILEEIELDLLRYKYGDLYSKGK